MRAVWGMVRDRPPPATGDGVQGSIAVRLALFYAAHYAMVGVSLPFWPVWLESRGLDPSEIGAVLAAGFWARPFAGPLAARVADRRDDRKTVMVLLAGVGLVVWLGFGVVNGVVAFVLLSIAANAALSPLAPLGDAIAMRHASAGTLDYARVRLWGSIAFIVASIGIGRWVRVAGSSVIHPWIVAGLAATLAACIALPRAPKGARAEGGGARRASEVLLDRRFIVFLAATALVQSSHVVYYGFASIHWRSLGIPETTVGLLWAEGVLAEILLFAAGDRVTSRIGPVGLIAIGGAAGVIRWTALAAVTDLGVLFVIQSLHALTFGAAHLGAMRFLVRAVPDEHAGTAQSVHGAAVVGVGLGLTTPVAGMLYEGWGAYAYLFAAALSAAGVVASLALSLPRPAR